MNLGAETVELCHQALWHWLSFKNVIRSSHFPWKPHESVSWTSGAIFDLKSTMWSQPFHFQPVSSPFWLTKNSELPWKLAFKNLNSSPIFMKIHAKTQFSIPKKRKVKCGIMCFLSSFKFRIGMRERGARTSCGQRAASLGMAVPS